MLPTLLIVDDEKSTRDGLRGALEEEFDVYTAAGAGSSPCRDTINTLPGSVRLDSTELIGRIKSPMQQQVVCSPYLSEAW